MKRTSLILLLGVVGLSSPVWMPGASSHAQDVPETVPGLDEKALTSALRSLAAARDHDGLLERSSRTLKDHPSSVVALQYRAFALDRLGRQAAARNAYEELLRAAPQHVWGLTQLARLRSETGEVTKAIALFERAVQVDPSTLDARYGLASLLRRRRRYAESVTHLSAALEHDDDKSRAHAALGYAHWYSQAFDDARRQWKLAKKAGYDAATCDRALALVLHDQITLPADRKQAQETQTRRQNGDVWTLDYGHIQVRTRVGPRLTDDVDALLRATGQRIATLLGSEKALPDVVLHLARTREEHELARQRLFPRGPKDKAFLIPAGIRRGSGRGFGSGRSGGGSVQASAAQVYACWFPAGLENSLVHELTHAVTQAHARFVPIWADEGLATYAEPSPGDTHAAAFGAVRNDLLLTLEIKGDDQLRLLPLLNASPITFHGVGTRNSYAGAWSLVHYLLHGHRKGMRGFRTLLQTWATKPGGGIRAFKRVYGDDFETFESGWRRHIRKLRK